MDELEQASGATREEYAERLMRALVHIERKLDAGLDGELDGEVGLEAIARVARFSPYHFHRVFAAGVGEPVSAYVRRVRLERAAAMLVHGDDRVADIARRSGFGSVEGFGRAFKRAFGVSPRQFRVSLGRSWLDEQAARSEDELRERISSRLRRPVGRPVDVEVRRFEGARLVGVRHRGPYHRVGIAWGRVMAWAGMRGLLTRDSRLIGIAHDDPAEVPSRELRYDACVEVRGDDWGGVRVGRGVSRIEIPPLDVAAARHTESYDAIPRTYEFVYWSWLAQSGREPGDYPSFCEHPRGRVRGRKGAGDGVRAWVHVPLKELV